MMSGASRLRRKRAANVVGGRRFRHEVKVDETTEAKLVALAEYHHMSVPRLLVSSTLNRSDQISAADKRELLMELFALQRLVRAVGVNVNQIAKAVNSDAELPAGSDAVMAATATALRRIDDALAAFSLGDGDDS